MSYIIILCVIGLLSAMYLNVMNGALRALALSHRKAWLMARSWPTPQRMVVEDFKYRPLQIERRMSRYETLRFHHESNIPVEKIIEREVVEMQIQLFDGLVKGNYIELTSREDELHHEKVLCARIYVALPPTR